MSADDYTAQREALDARLEQLRRDDAHTAKVLQVLWDIAVLEMQFGRVDGARAVLTEMGPLRSHRVDAEIVYYLVASRIAVFEGDGPRGVWLAERAVLLSRRDVGEHLPGALHVLSIALEAAGREEERRWAELEAAERFEEAGDFGRAWMLVQSWADVCPDDDPSRLQRLLALAVAADDASAQVSFHRQLGDWHAGRGHYLPARQAYERALTFGDRVSADECNVTRLNLGVLECSHGHEEDGLRRFDEVLATTASPLGRALSLHARAAALHNLHRHGEARRAAEAAAEALDALERADDAAECWALARLSRDFAFLHRFPRWLIDHEDGGEPGKRLSGWRRRAALWLFVANGLLVAGALALAMAVHDLTAWLALGVGLLLLFRAQVAGLSRHLRDRQRLLQANDAAAR